MLLRILCHRDCPCKPISQDACSRFRIGTYRLHAVMTTGIPHHCKCNRHHGLHWMSGRHQRTASSLARPVKLQPLHVRCQLPEPLWPLVHTRLLEFCDGISEGGAGE